MGNGKLKKIFLILSMISLSILLVVIPTTYSINSQNLGLWTSYMHEEKKLIEEDFYRSNVFEFRVLRPITSWLGESVKNVEDSVDDYIRRNTRHEWNNEQEKEVEIVPTREQAKKALEREINYSKGRLEHLQSIKFMVINTEDNTYYTNTPYKTLEEYNKNVGDYVNIEIQKSPSSRSYVKDINGKMVKNSSYDLETKILNSTPQENLEIHMSFPKRIYESDRIFSDYRTYNQDVKIAQLYMVLVVINLAVFIVSTLIYKKINKKVINENGKLFNLLRKIPIEILIGLMFIDFFFYIVFSFSYYLGYRYILEKICAFIGAFILVLALYILLKIYFSYDKKLDMLKNTIAYKIYDILRNLIINVLNSSKKIPLIKRIIALAIICTIGSVFLGLLIGTFAITPFISMGIFTWYIVKKLCYLAQIIDGTDKIKNGELNYKVDVKGYDNFTVLAQNINNIGEGLEKSIDNQLRSERMKSELITNVSHDLKTPLTSIINYVELIKKEENIQPEHIKDYVSVLDSKSRRLKLLIEDLFEASKASSGNIELNMENIDIKQLLRQSIGEMEEKLAKANLDLKLNMPEDKIYINADGRRMYRVFENLLSNIAKYSLPNTRVYIDLVQSDENIRLTMKNISSYELNFDADEITERFKRADESRNTEGSGLGLAISKDLVKIQGGSFEVEIDGDLFKASLQFKRVEK